MPRRREIAKREVPADPIYNSPLVTKFISTIMRGGKRSTAERIMYKALDIVKEKTADDPLKVFKKAHRERQAEPRSEVAPRRRLELPGAGRGESEPPPVARDPLGRRLRAPSAATARRCRRSWRTSSSTRPTCAAAP